MDIRELTKGKTDCACGREHHCPIDIVDISESVWEALSDYVRPYHRILLVADRNTDRVAGSRVREVLGEKVTSYVILDDNGDHVVVPNEEKIAEIESFFSDNDLIFGVGSGVINDLSKYTSFDKGVPYFIFATAPSMDGYASVGAAMILGGMKVTTNARPPKAILADPRILKDAPFEMLQAGYGDIVGKFSCLNDWKLSAVVNGEYLCEYVWQLMYDTAVRVRELAEGIRTRDPEAVGALMEALVVAGIAMAYVGNSRPASGSEHHLSHFFEITGILDHAPYFCHGIDVAYAAVVTAAIREKILKLDPEFRPFRRERWETEIRRLYKTSAEGVMKLQDKLGWHEKEELQSIREKWPEIREVLLEAPTEAEMLQMLSDVGLSYPEFEALYGARKIHDAVWYAKDLKDRYSVLWLLDQYAAKAGDPDVSKIRVVAMDLDGTLCQHKSPLPEENRKALAELSKRYKLLMTGAGMCRRIFSQMEEFPIDILGTYGMQFCTYDPETKDLKTVRDRVIPCDRESIERRV
ncbi:MAG: iron-containing alcohol dehydrogenase, partial [Lachnospiraceae bacterium]|nr:iron-containing alcohol dehydrogenase [Lachnospiraceae bacterium]